MIHEQNRGAQQNVGFEGNLIARRDGRPAADAATVSQNNADMARGCFGHRVQPDMRGDEHAIAEGNPAGVGAQQIARTVNGTTPAEGGEGIGRLLPKGIQFGEGSRKQVQRVFADPVIAHRVLDDRVPERVFFRRVPRRSLLARRVFRE